MLHVKPISRARFPQVAMSLLEKQAFTEMLEQNLSQIMAFLSFISGLKPDSR